MKAFKYHIELADEPIDVNDETQLRERLIALIKENIGSAVYAELSENEKLMSSIKTKLKPKQHHEQQ